MIKFFAWIGLIVWIINGINILRYVYYSITSPDINTFFEKIAVEEHKSIQEKLEKLPKSFNIYYVFRFIVGLATFVWISILICFIYLVI